MNKVKVLYYTSPYFLDIAIEVIKILKDKVDLHVLIEITNNSKKANILDLEYLPNQSVVSVVDLLRQNNCNQLIPYFEGCISANFIVHKYDSAFSFSAMRTAFKLWQFINLIKPNIIHLESSTLRTLGLIPFLFSSKKIFITIHDPIPHSGENNWKVSLPRKLFLKTKYQRSYFFYSEFAKKQFETHYKHDKYPKHVKKMYPLSFYQNFITVGIPKNKHILFFGRLSPYKGIDNLLHSMPLIFERYPEEILIIAGRSSDDFIIDQQILTKYKSRIILLNRYIPNQELVTLIQQAKIVICPYLDATQSGVLMTSFALNTPVVATETGAFPEYIINNLTGILVPVNDHRLLADGIQHALKHDFYSVMKENLENINKASGWFNNKDIMLNAYLN